MENLYQKTVPEFVETNLQYTKQRFKIPTNTNKEFRNTRRIIIREAYKQLLSKLNGKNYIKNNFLGRRHLHYLEREFPKGVKSARKRMGSMSNTVLST